MKHYFPIISKNFVYSNLLLNDKGLFYKVVVENDKHIIFLSDDIDFILSLFELNSDLFEGRLEPDVFSHLISSPYFNLRKFKIVKDNNSSYMLKDFAEFIQKAEDESPELINREFKYISLGQLEELFPGLKNNIEEARYVLENFSANKNLKLGGKYILEAIPDYDKTQLSTTWPKFMESFGSKYIQRCSRL